MIAIGLLDMDSNHETEQFSIISAGIRLQRSMQHIDVAVPSHRCVSKLEFQTFDEEHKRHARDIMCWLCL